MSPETPFDDVVTSRQTFDDTLRQLIVAAMGNDVDPTGPWVYRNGDGTTDWEIIITELEGQSDSD